MALVIDIAVESEAWSGLSALEPLVRRSIEAAAGHMAADLPDGSEVSVLLCDDAAIQVLNREWRAVDKPTNVLSFPAEAQRHDGPRLLGDIAIAFETTRREAEADGKVLTAHVAHLLVHGFLHLLDHDHETEAKAVAMEALETRILASLGIADPYAGSEPVAEACRS